MSYEIKLTDGTLLFLQISSTLFKTWRVWKVQFKNGKEAVLFKCGTEWMQRNEDELDLSLLLEIGRFIDGVSLEKHMMPV